MHPHDKPPLTTVAGILELVEDRRKADGTHLSRIIIPPLFLQSLRHRSTELVGPSERAFKKMENVEIMEAEVDLLEFAERGEQVPHAKTYRVRIDCEVFKIDIRHPTGEMLLAKAGKHACAYELIAEFAHRENEVVEPGETVDIGKHGLKGFITAHKEIATIFINGDPYPIERGKHSVADILSLVGQSTDAYDLLEEKNGPPLPVPADHPVHIEGCEVFHTQVKGGGSS
jgi:hypothetical protein